ncbi:MAG TPA: hypothetical protein VJ810_08580, partial [Blastocatellia bacterium]|nr:hypothetical protein [Blastocatellia bacterium]
MNSVKRSINKTALYVFIIITFGAAVMTAFVERGVAKRQESKRARAAQREIVRQDPKLAAKRREIETKMRDSRYLMTRAEIFDPLEKEPGPVTLEGERLETSDFQTAISRLKQTAAKRAAAAQPTETSGHFIVQYRGAIKSAQTASLRARGFEIAGYLPNNAYIVKATADNAAKLKSSGEARWVGAYGAGLKVEPELLAVGEAGSSPNDTGVIHVSLVSFRGESVDELREAINRLPLAGERVFEERGDGRVWAALAVRREDLPKMVAALANIESVEWLERRRPHRMSNDNGVRAVQTGFAGGDTPLYRQGLTGAGQIYGAADSGLDTDHSQFRLDGNTAAQTLSFATTSASLTDGLLPFRITNQNNKVLTYYLVGSSGFKDLADNPNGGRT